MAAQCHSAVPALTPSPFPPLPASTRNSRSRRTPPQSSRSLPQQESPFPPERACSTRRFFTAMWGSGQHSGDGEVQCLCEWPVLRYRGQTWGWWCDMVGPWQPLGEIWAMLAILPGPKSCRHPARPLLGWTLPAPASPHPSLPSLPGTPLMTGCHPSISAPLWAAPNLALSTGSANTKETHHGPKGGPLLLGLACPLSSCCGVHCVPHTTWGEKREAGPCAAHWGCGS